MIRLAREVGLSDRGLAKFCARHRIPVPGRGFWARVASGPPCAYRECVDPFEELFEEIEKSAPDWYWNR
jgi:hypothetical protein